MHNIQKALTQFIAAVRTARGMKTADYRVVVNSKIVLLEAFDPEKKTWHTTNHYPTEKEMREFLIDARKTTLKMVSDDKKYSAKK